MTSTSVQLSQLWAVEQGQQLLGKVDVDIGGKQQGFAIEPQPPRRRRGIQIPKSFIAPNQAEPAPLDTALVHMYFSVRRRFCS